MARRRVDIKLIMLLLNYLEERGRRVPVEEVLSIFGLFQDELSKIADTIIYCGTPPYTFDAQFTFEIEDGLIEFSSPLYKTPSPGFTQKEAFAFLFALHALEELYKDSGSVELEVIEKVKRAIPEVLFEAAKKQLEPYGVVLRFDAPDGFFNAAREAKNTHKVLKISYYSFQHHQVKEYKVAPIGIRLAYRNYYLLAVDIQDKTPKTFLCDNIVDYELTDSEFIIDAELKKEAEKEWENQFLNKQKEKSVTLVFSGKAARFVAESFPPEDTRWIDDDRIEVRIRFISEDWLITRWILPFSGEVSIKEPEELVRNVEKLLKRAEEMVE